MIAIPPTEDLKLVVIVISGAANLIFTVRELKKSMNGIGSKVNAQFSEWINSALAHVGGEDDAVKRWRLVEFYKRGNR